ncbi:CARDB domain-containing protein [Chitinophaga sp.]|uniref:CARDB domain-containing protein n=1 Tax=Chitinophaga sp. TaxID=1869181 RepID=UPI0031D5EC1D
MIQKTLVTTFALTTLALQFFLFTTACRKPLPKEALHNGLATTQPLSAQSANLKVGINGHPLNTYAYNASSSTVAGVSYTTQAAMIEQLGMGWYRIDVSTQPDGQAVNHAKLLDIIAKCSAKNIKILPMVYDRCRYDGTPQEAYDEAFAQMAGFAALYGQYFDHFELGNEWELFDHLLSNGDGRVQSNYDMARVLIAEQYVKGMEEGLKSVLPNAKSMVNTAGYFPIFWMDRMLAAAPTINICAWHLYSEMPSAYQGNLGISNIHQYLFNRYQRPIWYTETNARSKETLTQQQNEDRSNDWRIRLTSEVQAEPSVEAIIFHELLDQPERAGSANYEEENFGFVKFNGYPGKTDSVAFNAWKADPNRYQNWSYKKQALDSVRPDLVVTDVTWVPAFPEPGEVVTFTAVIKNQGDTATPAGVIHGVAFKLNGVNVGCNGSSVTSLAPGASRTLTANGCLPSTWTAALGTHSVVATVDDQFRFNEKSETNNTRTETFTVNPPRPDMIVTDITWTPANPVAGDVVRFTAVVKNVGTVATPASVINGVNFKVNGASVGCNGSYTASLAPGASITLVSNGCSPSTWTAVSGTHTVVVKTDDQNRFAERDETNNTRTESIVIP